MILKMTVKNKILFPSLVILVGYYFAGEICEASVLVGISNEKINPEELYKMDVEIFRNIDRHYNIFRKAKVWERFKISEVKSDFKFHVNDTNTPEIKHYMNFFGSLGTFFKNLTLMYSVLYTKYTAMFYAIHLLNIYKEKKENEAEENLEIIQSYLRISQYFALYAITGNTVIYEAIPEIFPEHLECAKLPYKSFKSAHEVFLNGMYKKFFNNDLTNKDTWKSVFNEYKNQIEIVNKYFTTLLTGIEDTQIDVKNWLTNIQMEQFFLSFVSDLVVIKGRDIDETYYKNYDNEDKHGMYEANVVNVMWTIANRLYEKKFGKGKEEPSKDEKETAKDEKETAKDDKEPAKKEKEPAKDKEEPAKDKKEPAKGKEELAKDEKETAKDEKELAEDKEVPAKDEKKPAEVEKKTDEKNKKSLVLMPTLSVYTCIKFHLLDRHLLPTFSRTLSKKRSIKFEDSPLKLE